MSYVDSVWILSKVFVVRVVILDGIGVISGQFPSFQSLFQLSHPHGGNGQIAQKEQHNKALCPPIIQNGTESVAKKDHYAIFTVIFWIQWVLLVDSTSTENIV